MVQLWPGIPPEVLCDMYLNSSINEGLNLLIRYHMAKGHRIDGWIRNGCVDLELMHARLRHLIVEAYRRGKSWKYEYADEDDLLFSMYYRMAIMHDEPLKNQEAISQNPAKLAAKCLTCRYRETRCKRKETCVERLKVRGMI